MNYQREVEFARRIALAAGENAISTRAGGVTAEVKPDASPVTMTARTPKSCNSAIRAAESLRGGSLSAMRPASFIPAASPTATGMT